MRSVLSSLGKVASSPLTIAARLARQSDPGYVEPRVWRLDEGGKPASIQFFNSTLDKTRPME